MLLSKFSPRNLLSKLYIYRTFKSSKNLKKYTFMSGNEESLLPEMPDEYVVKKTLASNISLKVC